MKYFLQLNGEYSGTGVIIDGKDAAVLLPILERCPKASTHYNQERHMMEYVLDKGRLPSVNAIPIESIVLPQGSIRDTVSIIQDYPAFMKEVQQVQKDLADAAEQDTENAQRTAEAASRTMATTNDEPL